MKDETAELLDQAKGVTTYFLVTLFPGAEIEEDGPQDLVKVGESIRPPTRVRHLSRRSPIPARLSMTVTPWRDYWAHHFIQHDSRWQQAYEFGLPAPTEWFRGGTEMSLFMMFLTLVDEGVPLDLRWVDHETGHWHQEPSLAKVA